MFILVTIILSAKNCVNNLRTLTKIWDSNSYQLTVRIELFLRLFKTDILYHSYIISV